MVVEKKVRHDQTGKVYTLQFSKEPTSDDITKAIASIVQPSTKLAPGLTPSTGRPELQKPVPSRDTRSRIEDVEKVTPTAFVTNILPRSIAGRLIATSEIITKPVQTAKSFGTLAQVLIGITGTQNVLPKELRDKINQTGIKFFEGVGSMLKERYGSLDKAKETVLRDPGGFADDLSIILMGTGAGIKTFGKARKLSGVSKAGEVIQKTAPLISPAGATTVAAGRFGKALGSPKDIAVQQASKRLGVELPASALTDSKAVATLEAISAKSLGGGKVMKRIDDAMIKLSNVADDVVTKADAIDDISRAGKVIGDNFNNYRSRWFGIKDKLYSKAKIPTKGLRVDTANSSKYAKEMLSQQKQAEKILGKSANRKFWEDVNKNLRGNVEASDLKVAIKEINNMIKDRTNPISTKYNAQLKKLATLMSDELDNTIAINRPDLAKNIDRANRVYRSGLEKMNSALGKKLNKAIQAEQYDTIPKVIDKSLRTSIDDIDQIKELVGTKNWKTVQASTMRGLFDKSINPATGKFRPNRLATEIEKFGRDKLQRILTPNQIQQIDDIAITAKSLGKPLQVISGSQTGFINKMLLLGATTVANPIRGLKIILGDALFNSIVGSQVGQKTLTEGLDLIYRTGRAVEKAAPAVGTTAAIERQLEVPLKRGQ